MATHYGKYTSPAHVTQTTTTTTSTLNSMLKEYLSYDLLKTEVEKRSYFIQKAQKKTGYKGGVMPIPFEAGQASSFRYGKLITGNKITRSKYVKGFLNGYKEIWGALKFDDHDLKRHDDPKQSFVGALLKEVPKFAEGMKELVSKAFFNGPDLTIVTDVTNAATGVLGVARPEMLEYGQLVEIAQSTESVASQIGYISEIDIDAKTITVVTTMADVDTGSGAVDLTLVHVPTARKAITNGASLRIEDGFIADLQFSNIADQLLSAANGGSTQLFGLTKKKYPFLQAINADGSGLATGGDLLDKIFDTYTKAQTIGKLSNPNEVVMSFKNLASVQLALEKGQFGNGRDYTANDRKVTAFGWTSIEVAGIKGSLTLVGVNEMRDDMVYGLDWRFIDIHSNGMIEKVVDANGNEFYTERSDEGYSYIVDIRFFGELVVSKPSYQFVINHINL